MTRTWSITFGPRRHGSRVGLVVLVSGMVASVAAGVWLWHAHQDHLKAAEARQQVINANEEVKRQAEVSAQQAHALADQRSRDPRWQQAKQTLNWPWLGTLTAVEQLTRPPVYLLAYKPDATTGWVTLEAECDVLEDALHYVTTLSGAPLFEQVRLIRHEQVQDTASGRMVVRFAVQFRGTQGAF